MSLDRKSDWRCQKCKYRKLSTDSNNAYHIIIDDTPQQSPQQKQQREDDADGNESSKRFKNSLSLNDVNNSVYALKTEVSSVKTDLGEIKTTIQQLALTVNNNNQINTSIQAALNTITNTLSNLTSQVSELCESNKEKEKKIGEMENRINDLEQQLLNKNIEIKNITQENMTANDVVKKIATYFNVVMNDYDISNSYIIKKNNKMIIEFTTLNKKRELMAKIHRHRIEENVISGNMEHKNIIYINDDLTAYKRHLLWLAKKKSRESNWKFIWVKNANIYAKKNENSNTITINNVSDVQLITSTN